VRDLIRQMGQANPTCDSPQIVDELRKLGIEVAKSTVEKYRPRSKRPPSLTWKTFLKNHVQDLVALDYFVVPRVTFRVLTYRKKKSHFCAATPAVRHCLGKAGGAISNGISQAQRGEIHRCCVHVAYETTPRVVV
jgi:hypothetical protein